MGETVRMTCRVCGYTTTVNVGSTMGGDKPQTYDDAPPYDMEGANTCPRCGRLTFWQDGVDELWD